MHSTPRASHSRAYTPERTVPSVPMMPMRRALRACAASRTASRGMWMIGTLVNDWILS